MAKISRFGAVTVFIVLATAALVAVLLLSSVLLGPPKAASAQVPTTPNCAPVPEGSMAAWWPWNGNANDIKNNNTATLFGNPPFDAAGKVGQALRFDGVDDYAKASASSSLNVGAGDGLTIEAWIRPGSTRDAALVEWNNGTMSGVGTHLWIFSNGRLYANLKDTAGVDHTMGGAPITTNTYQHVALTYDKSSGQARLYRNGVVGGGVNLDPGSVTPQTTYDLYFGRRPASGYWPYVGQMDEPGIFNRALTQQEIQGIYNAGNATSPAGKCPDDSTDPSSAASATTADGNPYTAGALTKSDVSVNLTAEDAAGGWGVEEITYSATGDPVTGGQTIAQQSVQGNSATLPAITQEGVTTVTYHATDKAGNAETEKTFVVKIDKSAPLVRSVSPVKGATNVALTSKPSAMFWEQMKPETFTKANVKMMNMNTKKRIPVKVSCDDPCTTVTIVPSSVLERRTKYKVTILGGASGPQNVVGIPLEKSEVWTFTSGRR